MDQIFSRELQFKRGAEAAYKKKSRDDHGMNPGSAAIPDWQAGHDHVTKARQQHARGQQGRAEP